MNGANSAMPGTRSEEPDELAIIVERSRARFLDRLSLFVDETDQLLVEGDLQGEIRDALGKIAFDVHKIAGVAATVGFVEIGKNAAALEQDIKNYLNDPPQPEAELKLREKIETFLGQVDSVHQSQTQANGGGI